MDTLLLLAPLPIGLIAYGIHGYINSPADLPKLKLEPQFIPPGMHYLNVRAAVSKEEWDKVKWIAHKKSSNGPHKCEICESSGKKQGFRSGENFNWDLECHEVFSFNWSTRTMKLERLMSLCPLCHKTIHYFLTKKMGTHFDETLDHFLTVSNIDHETAELYVKNALKLSKAMNTFSFRTFSKQWKLDLTYLNNREFSRVFPRRTFTKDERKNCNPKIIY
jgi:hypothetical protein